MKTKFTYQEKLILLSCSNEPQNLEDLFEHLPIEINQLINTVEELCFHKYIFEYDDKYFVNSLELQKLIEVDKLLSTDLSMLKCHGAYIN